MSFELLDNEGINNVLCMYWHGPMGMSKESRDKFYHMGVIDYGTLKKNKAFDYFFCSLSFTGLWLAYTINKKNGLKTLSDWESLDDIGLESIKIK